MGGGVGFAVKILEQGGDLSVRIKKVDCYILSPGSEQRLEIRGVKS